jgi:hypothetical protein
LSKEKESQTLPGAIHGEIRYPYGTVAHATVRAGDVFAITDDAGKYEMPALVAGSYTVSVEPPFPGYEATAENIVLAPGETRVLDINLDFEKTLVDGYVYDKDGKPVEGATLSELKCGKFHDTAVTDGTGYFKFDRASPGAQFIRVNAPGYMGQTLDFAANKGEKTSLEFHLVPATHKIHGTLSDEKGNPIDGEVVLSSESGIMLQRTASNAETGYFELPALPGTYNVLATSGQHSSEGWRGSVSADTKLDFKLKPLQRVDRTPDHKHHWD